MKTTEYSYPSNLALVHPETSSGLNLQDLDSASQSGEDDLSAGLSGGCTGEPRPYKMSQTPNERRRFVSPSESIVAPNFPFRHREEKKKGRKEGRKEADANDVRYFGDLAEPSVGR